MAQLACPKCGATYAAANVNVALGVAACAACGEVHDLSERPSLARRSPGDPAGIAVADDHVRIGWWHVPTIVGLGLFCLIWDLSLVAMVAAAVADGHFEALFFGSFHALAGVGLTYLLACTLVNATRVQVGAERIEVLHEPLPWPWNPSVDRAEVRQVYVIEDRGSKGQRSYSVHAQLANGHAVRLLRGLATPGRARFVEEWLERKLGLVDVPVGGEHV